MTQKNVPSRRMHCTASLILAVACILPFSGCYTQFATLDRNIADNEPIINKGPGQDTCTTCDSAKGVAKSRIDTIVIKDGRRQVCYWTRNFWGDPQLKCVETQYSHDWMVYNEYPWWYRERPYYYDSYGRCPRFYYYDSDCGCCRYYRSTGSYYNPWYQGGGGYGGGGYSGGGGSYGGSGGSSGGSSGSSSSGRPSPMTQSRDDRSSGTIHRVPSTTPENIPKPAVSEPVPAPSTPIAQPAPSPAPQTQEQAPVVNQDSTRVRHIPSQRRGSLRDR